MLKSLEYFDGIKTQWTLECPRASLAITAVKEQGVVKFKDGDTCTHSTHFKKAEYPPVGNYLFNAYLSLIGKNMSYIIIE